MIRFFGFCYTLTALLIASSEDGSKWINFLLAAAVILVKEMVTDTINYTTQINKKGTL